MHLAVWLVLLVAFTSVLSAVKTTTIASHIWNIYIRFSSSGDVKSMREKRAELAAIRIQRTNTSSKDEFAKWARLDRQHRKLKNDLDALNTKVAASRQRLQRYVQIIRWISTSGIKLYIQYSYRKVAVIWLPRGVFPSYIEWFLSFPSAPRGSVSVATWVSITSAAFGTFLSTAKTLKTAAGI